jgi:hypothetical protein
MLQSARLATRNDRHAMWDRGPAFSHRAPERHAVEHRERIFLIRRWSRRSKESRCAATAYQKTVSYRPAFSECSRRHTLHNSFLLKNSMSCSFFVSSAVVPWTDRVFIPPVIRIPSAMEIRSHSPHEPEPEPVPSAGSALATKRHA